MNTLLLQLVTLTSSFLIALPAGWCGGLMHNRADSAAAQATCCQRLAHQESQKAPAQPSVNCCCSWDVALPQNQVQPDDTSAALMLCVADHSHFQLNQRISGEASHAPFRSGPRLHVLQCVWLC